jgi:eukaryotic-like serine/threonine-protein kinase
MAICPQCHTQHPDDVRVCPHDGSVLMSDESLYATEADLIAGQMVGEYQIEAKIGAGGFGTVYRAEQPLIGKQVAVKVLNRSYSSNPQMVSRFVAEARAVNQIRHRNIIDIFSFGVLPDKRQYFVMEYLDGMPFDEYIKSRGRLPIEEAIPILRQIAKALDAAHAAGIAHRDLKPENVFLAMDGDGAAYPKLLDFGIAKLLGESTTSGHKTRTGTPIGTPYYMSPEQCLGKGVDHRADIYSFGVMTHEVLTGKLPFDAEEMMTVMFKQMNAEPPAMSSVCPELLHALDGPVLRMLSKKPEERPSSVAEGVESLAQAARDAGLDVTVAPVWRPGATPPFSGMNTPGPMTPAEQLEIASAKTMAAAESGTLSASSVATERSPSLGSGKNKVPVIAGAAALVVAVLGGIGGFFALRSTSDAATPSASAATSATERVAPSAPSETASVEPAASVAPAVPVNVQLTIQSVPKSVEAYAGDEKLGSSPGPLKLTRSDKPVELTFKASGYHDKVISLVPKDDAIVSVNLARVSTGRAKPSPTKKKTGSGEIENPF